MVIRNGEGRCILNAASGATVAIFYGAPVDGNMVVEFD